MCMGIYVPAYMSVCVPDMWMMPPEVRKHQIPWDQSYRWLWATQWMLELKPGPLKRMASVLKHWAVCPDACFFYVLKQYKQYRDILQSSRPSLPHSPDAALLVLSQTPLCYIQLFFLLLLLEVLVIESRPHTSHIIGKCPNTEPLPTTALSSTSCHRSMLFIKCLLFV